MSECVFCAIAAGRIPARFVYEDDQVMAFLDINPLASGHTLVVPKAHAERLTELSPEASAGLFRRVPALAAAVVAATGAEGFNILQNNGRCAGQAVGHLHVHIIPRRPGDGLGYRWPARPAEEGELQRLEQAIRTGLGAAH